MKSKKQHRICSEGPRRLPSEILLAGLCFLNEIRVCPAAVKRTPEMGGGVCENGEWPPFSEIHSVQVGQPVSLSCRLPTRVCLQALLKAPPHTLGTDS